MKKKLFSYEVTWLADHEMGNLLNFSQSKIMRKFGKPRKLEQAQAATTRWLSQNLLDVRLHSFALIDWYFWFFSSFNFGKKTKQPHFLLGLLKLSFETQSTNGTVLAHVAVFFCIFLKFYLEKISKVPSFRHQLTEYFHMESIYFSRPRHFKQDILDNCG